MLKVYASGSRGNFYEINDGETSIALECGVTFKKMQKLCGFHTAKFSGCIVSHEHQDHAKAVSALLDRGIRVYMSAGTAQALGIDAHSFVQVMQPLKAVKIGTLIVKPFLVEHDAREPFGFLILSRTTGKKLLFATDTQCIRYKFRGVHEIAVECNYSEELLRESDLPDVVKTRIRKSHMSLETVKEFLRQTDLRKTERIYLLHLSGQNSAAEVFREEIQMQTGIETIVGVME